ncbi:GntR family transcriptional regulator [Nonomuraea turkmeniaca]|uniref:GntR family transcriptional regulator n=1 Tax=Nonomuraea turkmeniaca TaxID=103838 RepID=A0A5S4F069_9ACTN|nr:GntR family transcriptional regulator [Nonomuraea turkmeniaca]
MPIYQQVADEIRRRIDSGAIPPGHAVPSEQQIEDEFEVSRITATKALRLLREEGIVYLVPGRGTFVGPEDAPRVSQTTKPYERIAADIAQRIKAGELRPDYPIPSETTLRQQYHVAKGTVRRAVALLREQGWVFTVEKRGSYVSPRANWPAGE